MIFQLTWKHCFENTDYNCENISPRNSAVLVTVWCSSARFTTRFITCLTSVRSSMVRDCRYRPQWQLSDYKIGIIRRNKVLYRKYTKDKLESLKKLKLTSLKAQFTDLENRKFSCWFEFRASHQLYRLHDVTSIWGYPDFLTNKKTLFQKFLNLIDRSAKGYFPEL